MRIQDDGTNTNLSGKALVASPTCSCPIHWADCLVNRVNNSLMNQAATELCRKTRIKQPNVRLSDSEPLQTRHPGKPEMRTSEYGNKRDDG